MDFSNLILAPCAVLQFIPYFFVVTLILIIVPACFATEIGIRRLYIRALVKMFDWSTAKLKKSESRILSTSDDIIEKENPIKNIEALKKAFANKQQFEMDDIAYFVKSGVEAIIDDKVTKRFSAEELPSWNLLTRTNYQYYFVSPAESHLYNVRLSIMWFFGVLLRYCVLFPLRIVLTIIAMTIMAAMMVPLSKLSDSAFKRKAVYFTNVLVFRICCRAFSAVVTYHDRQNMPSKGGICVANHTTTLDVAILMQDRPYAVLGQIHGGYLGWVQRTLSNCARHVWFQRGERLQQEYVKKRLLDHVSDPKNYPLLIFPEGTCVNNSAVMMFKKGSFEVPTTIFPVAIKYNPWFGDAFWDSSKHSMLQYLGVVMTSWAIVADVWYLPPMTINEGEHVLEFTERVQMEIMKKGGLIDCSIWDGQLKRRFVRESERELIQKQICELFQKVDNTPKIDENTPEVKSAKRLSIAEIVESKQVAEPVK